MLALHLLFNFLVTEMSQTLPNAQSSNSSQVHQALLPLFFSYVSVVLLLVNFINVLPICDPISLAGNQKAQYYFADVPSIFISHNQMLKMVKHFYTCFQMQSQEMNSRNSFLPNCFLCCIVRTLLVSILKDFLLLKLSGKRSFCNTAAKFLMHVR